MARQRRVAAPVAARTRGRAPRARPTPTTQSTPPDTTETVGLNTRRDEPGLDVADARATRDDGDVDARQPTAQIVGHGVLEDRRAEHRRDDVGPAGHREAQHGHERSGRRRDRTRQSRSPQTTTATMIARPWRRDPVHPAGRERPERARRPTPRRTARPTASAPPWNWVTARIGNSARGIPKIIAIRSTMNVDWSTRRPLRNRKPSASRCQPLELGLVRLLGVASGRVRPHQRDRGDRGAEAHDVDRVGPREAERARR